MNRISQLLLKQLTRPLSPSETAELQAWIDESDANRDLYARLSDPAALKSTMDLWHMVDSSRACANMQRRVDSILLPRRVMRYAAAAAAVIAVLGSLFLFRPDLHVGSASGPAMAVAVDTIGVDDIKPGVTRATLSDASGRSVLLNSSDTATVSTQLITSVVVEAREPDLCLDVPRGGEFKILLEDGTEVWLNSDSRLYYPREFSAGERRVRVEGEAYFSVATDSLRPFYVQTASQMLRVYGTSFNVRSYPEEGEVSTTLESGSVALSRYGSQSGELYLTPGHQAVFNLSDQQVKVKPVDTEVVTSWKNGRFVFENQTLVRIMQDLSRWYDFRYEFTDPTLEDEIFMGSIPRYSDFTTAIAILEKCGGIRFAATDGTVIISRIPK